MKKTELYYGSLVCNIKQILWDKPEILSKYKVHIPVSYKFSQKNHTSIKWFSIQIYLNYDTGSHSTVQHNEKSISIKNWFTE